MAARHVRKNFNLFVDGRGYAGQVDEFTAPELVAVTEEYRAGGMVAPIALKMGMEAMQASFTMLSYDADILSQFGVAPGRQVNFTARELLESHDGATTAAVHTMRGEVVALRPGTSKPGALQPLEVGLALSYYRLQHGDRVVQEVDVENMVHIVNGEDILASRRTALGI